MASDWIKSYRKWLAKIFSSIRRCDGGDEQGSGCSPPPWRIPNSSHFCGKERSRGYNAAKHLWPQLRSGKHRGRTAGSANTGGEVLEPKRCWAGSGRAGSRRLEIKWNPLDQHRMFWRAIGKHTPPPLNCVWKSISGHIIAGGWSMKDLQPENWSHKQTFERGIWQNWEPFFRFVESEVWLNFGKKNHWNFHVRQGNIDPYATSSPGSKT